MLPNSMYNVHVHVNNLFIIRFMAPLPYRLVRTHVLSLFCSSVCCLTVLNAWHLRQCAYLTTHWFTCVSPTHTRVIS